MTPNEQALVALMENEGYSHGLVVTALRILSQSREAVTEAMLFIDGEHPSEEAFMEFLAEMCE